MKRLLPLCACLLVLASFAFGQNLLLKNATVYTFDRGVLAGYDLLILNGKIAKVEKGIVPNAPIQEIDLQGKSVIPGLIDSHTHIALAGGINEFAENVTPEVDMACQVYPDDPNIYYALSGGVTMVHTMHGSSNPIGGQNVTLKLKWGKSAEEMIEKRALRTLKMALGENPKVSEPPYTFPSSRMGVAEAIRGAFLSAREYRRQWDAYRQAKKAGRTTAVPPRRDLRLEALLEALDGKMVVRCHSYRADETLELIRLAREIGFTLQAFEHCHQAYRIADALKANHIGISVFADSWNYKVEASEFSPYGFKILYEKGVESP